jgi:D-glutamate cyclase
MENEIEAQITDLIGENLDRVVTIDWRCQGAIHPLYEVARRHYGGPLTMGAARKFVDKVVEGDIVLIMTGFPVGPFDLPKEKQVLFSGDMVTPETDGVVSAALVSRAVDLGFKAKPVLFCEEECVPIARACCRAAGLKVFHDFETSQWVSHSVAVLPFTKDSGKAKEEAERILDAMKPAAAISIERPGRNEKGCYHMANGRSITDFVAKLDDLFEGVAQRGGLTIGIGDLGNELGMGILKEGTRKFIFHGDRCECGCGGGIGASVPADATLFGAISDDVAYGFLAALSHLLSLPEILHSTDMEARVLEAACHEGAIDGPAGMSIPSIDYLDLKVHNLQIELMREIVQSPARFLKLQPYFYGQRIK